MDEIKVINKFTAVQIGTETVNDFVKVNLVYGSIDGTYYSQEHPQQEFDSHEEAVAYAYKKDKYSTWAIIPIVRFDNF